MLTNLSGGGGGGPGFASYSVVGSTQSAQANVGYIVNGAAQTSVVLPPSPNVGDIVRVTATGAGGWQWVTNSGQLILGLAPGATGGMWSAGMVVANRGWQSVASSADGLELVAADYLGPASGGGQIYTSTDAGSSWTARGSNHFWYAVASSADGVKLVAVDGIGTNFNGGQIYTSTDSGANWTARDTNRFWSAVASSSDGVKLVAVDYYGTNFNGGRIYTSTDSGATWTPRETNRYWNALASSTNGTRVVAVVDGGQIYTSTDSGVNWIARSTNNAWQSVASSADGANLVVVARGGQIFTSSNGGTNWIARDSNRYWYSVASSYDGTKLAAVDYLGSNFNGGLIYTSTDSGATWTPRATNRRWTSIASSSNGVALVAVEKAVDNYGITGGGQIWTSADSGATWIAITNYGVFQSGSSSPPMAGGAGASAGLIYLGNGLWQPLKESQLASSSVGTDQIADGSVTAAKLAGGLSGPGTMRWQSVAGTSVAAAAFNGYMLANAAQTTVTLPASPNAGDVVRVMGAGAGGWVIAQNAGQQIQFGATASTAGVAGNISGGQWATAELVYLGGGVFVVVSHEGTLTPQ
jgi:hypothetical protein